MQHRSTAIQGDAGQVVAGDATHDGASATNHLSNVITINNGKGDHAPEPIRKINDLQRRRIASKVHEVMDAIGMEKLEVYRIILTDFGLDEIRDLPRNQFKAVMETLERWIAEEREEREEPVIETSSAPASPERESQVIPTGPCIGCTAVESQLTRMRRWVVAAVGLALAAGGAAGYAVFTPAGVSAGTLARGSANAIAGSAATCQHDGKVYSRGSVTRMSDNTLYVCSASDSGAASWEVARDAAKRRTASS
ncbi:hypothetical protein LBW62_19915 [Ralstonia solanacearum]|uniref:hypothetical protein n=1 Tax=Ralstonia solanacearum TaxID=305 RepID=UPI0005C4591E|nr:hypothetical protein [Ralstonia solanacearum]MDB0543511.1 hypothetical protein [Ralstonia solanacearum]MDB0553975.1 hypothetical protein [Ralstonia solanacearum]MDB0558450.1 hypothetical protein [Ralstonia solanacearum]QNT25293.1 hypothetical protein C2I38_24875 [Ralstonia solanacearum]QNT62937.1 hypothetical protein C2L97_24910 [Ralstonia solanacearum]